MSGATFLIEELRRARVAGGLSQDELGKLINYSASHVSAIEVGTRPPRADYLAAVDEALKTGGLFSRLLREVVSVDAAVPWFRDWIAIEREARSLRWFEPAFVPGLLQTEEYARTTLASGILSGLEIENAVASRLQRQAILEQDDPPQFVAVLDEAILRRAPQADVALMAQQLTHLATCAERAHIQVHIVPEDVGVYPGLQGAFIIADLPDGGRVAHADNQLAAQIVDRPGDLARLQRTWERIRGEALPRRQSLDLIKEAAKRWT